MLKKVLAYLFFFLTISTLSYAGGINYLAGAQQMGLSYSAITQISHWGTFYNQAALSGIDKFSFGFYAERKFGIKSLNSGALSMAYPLKGVGTIGVSFYQFSNGSHFSQQKYGLALSRNFGDQVSAGLQLDAFNTHIQEYGSDWQVVAEAGLAFDLSEKIQTGIHVFNPSARSWEVNGKRETPPTANLGAAYQFSDKATWHLAVEKSISYDTRFKSGLTYNPLPALQIQAGIATAPTSYSFGIQYQWEWLTINMAFNFHQRLGMTPALSTNYTSQ